MMFRKSNDRQLFFQTINDFKNEDRRVFVCCVVDYTYAFIMQDRFIVGTNKTRRRKERTEKSQGCKSFRDANR